MRGERDAGRRVGARDLHDGERVTDGVRSGSAILFGKRQAHQPELGHLLHEIVWKLGFRVDLFRARSHFVARELSTQGRNRTLVAG